MPAQKKTEDPSFYQDQKEYEKQSALPYFSLPLPQCVNYY